MNVGGSNRKSRKRRAPMAEINVVPYIDVTFVLLMIFMITAPLVQTGVDVDLPQADSASVDLKDEPPVIISIKKDGSFFIDIGDRQDEPVDEGVLYSRVAAKLQDNPKAQIYVRGDHMVEYGKIVTVMAALKAAGAPKVGLMTTPPPEN
ncbi:protein TolR [Methylomonas lenta]|jgi:biopolymer transport protein TolR|uniref:Tol-Pal system protein TolR n=1 Tax=Methylomonas lenta TaxID=980561 RepID=A0A177NIS5_9GAMM|nr:protein TolR [Methylomonas lenta]MDD2739887.1 protein TolR [Methylomonas lenta]OAI18026.1 protein TolR [Methylomonas lenta]